MHFLICDGQIGLRAQKVRLPMPTAMVGSDRPIVSISLKFLIVTKRAFFVMRSAYLELAAWRRNPREIERCKIRAVRQYARVLANSAQTPCDDAWELDRRFRDRCMPKCPALPGARAK